MKKVLFATTALVAFAGAAAAEVNLSGYAEMGIRDTDADTVGVRFHTDIDVTFKLSGMTDGGLEFGASVDLDEVNNSSSLGGTAANGFNNENVWIKGEFGTLTMGDTDGAFDWALTEIGMLTTLADDHTTHSGYNGNSGLDGSTNSAAGDGLIARYDYSFGDFGVAISAELDSDAGDDNVLGLGFKYAGGMGSVDYGVGVGYQTNGTNDILGVSGKVSSAGFDAVVNYSDLDGFGGNDSYAGIGLGYTTGAFSGTINYGTYDLVGGGSNDGWGVAVNYDLGGGALLTAGYGNSDPNVGGDVSTWSAGLALSF